MASRRTEQLQTIGHNRVILACSFLPAGSGAPTGLSGYGFASVVRAAAGVFTLTLSDSYYQLQGWSLCLMQAAAGSLVAELRAESVSNATPTVTIAVVNKATGADADIAANADNRISVMLFLKNTTV
jgi:hypothetical protein